jgi:Peptidase family M23
VSGKGSALNTATPGGIALGLAPSPGLKAPPRGFPAVFMHEGIDLAAPTGTPIYAASDGIVVGATLNGGYGNWIRIDHPRKLSTVYGHLSEFAPGIKEGAEVSQRDPDRLRRQHRPLDRSAFALRDSEQRQGGRSTQLSRDQAGATARRRSPALSRSGGTRGRRTRSRDGSCLGARN